MPWFDSNALGIGFDGIDSVIAQISETDGNNSIQTDTTSIICKRLLNVLDNQCGILFSQQHYNMINWGSLCTGTIDIVTTK